MKDSLDLSITPKNVEFNLPKISDKAFRNQNFADYQYEVIIKSIKNFESALDDEHEVAVRLASFGQSVMMQVTEIGYSNPALIHFYGYVNGSKSELIQHVSQLNFLLMAAPKTEPGLPPRRIGFSIESNADQASE